MIKKSIKLTEKGFNKTQIFSANCKIFRILIPNTVDKVFEKFSLLDVKQKDNKKIDVEQKDFVRLRDLNNDKA